jgi:hypothetical protein
MAVLIFLRRYYNTQTQRRNLGKNRLFRDRTIPWIGIMTLKFITNSGLGGKIFWSWPTSSMSRSKFPIDRVHCLLYCKRAWLCASMRPVRFKTCVPNWSGSTCALRYLSDQASDGGSPSLGPSLHQAKAGRTKTAFFERHRLPRVFGCIDRTHICIQSPGPNNQEEVYVNQKNDNSIIINVQVSF